jgi:peptide/nickel transport system substrate-binding protein
MDWMHMRRKSWLTALTAASVVALSACTASPSATSSDSGNAASGGDLRIGEQYDLGTLDPQVLNSVGDQQMTTNIFENLTRHKLGGTSLEPGLATGWKSNDAGTSWTFTLRKGVQFQKGYGELKASDVVFTLTRLVDPKLASPNASLVKSIASVQADGDDKVVINLSAPDPSLLDKLASSYTAIVSEKAVTEKGTKFAQDPVGTGPYQFDHWTTGQETVLTGFDKYWGGKPHLDKVTYKPIPDVTTMNNAFQAGDLDMIQVTDPDLLGRYKKNDQYQISSTPGLITRFVGLKTDVAPFNDPRVRQALTYAINRPSMLKGLFNGISTPATGILSPAVDHASKNILNYKYDPDRAKQLLTQAGFPNGFDVTFSVPNIDRFTRPATVIQQDLAKVGIRVNIQVMESQSFLAALATTNGLQMYILSRGQDPTPDRILSTWFGSAGIPKNNWARVNDPEVDQWLGQATSTMDEKTRDDLFKKVQQKVADGNFYYYIDHEDFIFATSSKVKGFVADPFRSIRLDKTSMTGS